MPRARHSLDEVRKLARERLGFESLRPAQEQVLKLILSGRDVLSIMPTGSGKSAIYQLAALAIDGPTVVVSPLIALQKDQLDSLQDRGVSEAAVVNSATRAADKRDAFEKLDDGELEFLFLAPEQFANAETMARLKASPPSLFVVDEAHCVSEWGHDFRPDYCRLDAVIEELGDPRVIALTATASPQARQDIIERLGLHDAETVVWGFDRPNLFLEVERCPDAETKRRLVIDRVRDMPKPGIVYVATRAHAEEIAELLRGENLNASHYHGGMKAEERRRIQDAFMASDTAVIVATNAFGMGVDKPDVRFVLHYDISDSPDAYYQEIGRAGRDGAPAKALLLYLPADVGRRRAQAASGKLTVEAVEEVAQTLLASKRPVDPEKVAEKTGISETKLDQTLNRLQQAGAVDITPAGKVVASDRRADATELAEKVVEEQDKFRQQRVGRVEMIRDYAETEGCRRQYLLRYFGEELPAPCGHCDNCVSALAMTRGSNAAAASQARGVSSSPSGTPFAEKTRVTHNKYGAGTVMRYDGDKVVVLFDDHGYKSMVTQYVLDHDLMRAG